MCAYFPPTGSVVAYQGLPSSMLVGASIIGLTPVSLSGNPSISGTVNIGTIPGSVLAFPSGTIVTSLVSTVPSSVIVGSSIFGQLPAGTGVLGSVATLQGTSPWAIAGSVLAVQGTWSGSVLSQQSGTRITSVVGSIPSSMLVGNYGHRNDAAASFLGGNLTWNPLATDSAGRSLTKPFSSEDGTIISYIGSVVSASVTLIQASALGKKSYITDFLVTNTGSVAQLITFQDGSTSVLGYTIAPAGGGSNAVGWNIPMKTANAQDLAFVATGTSSIVYMTIKGYQAS